MKCSAGQNSEQRLAIRKDVLASLGATSKEAEELLRYNENRFDETAIDASKFPLPDEGFLATWRQYASETEQAGSILPLTKYLVQLQFPIQSAISETPDYIAATRQGLPTDGIKLAAGISLREPQCGQLLVHPTAAGNIPLLIAGNREDFVALVQALRYRNEPHPIPDSMGACMVAGYNNWHRISVLRNRFEASASANDSWPAEFQRIKAQKDLYQDRFIILSTGPYSAVNAFDIGLDYEEWLNLSMAIRREHECTHYFTRRVFSSMRNNLLDELIADYMGITAALGKFRADWLLRFFGLELFPQFRQSGRLYNYRGAPPLSDSAFALLQKLVVAAAANLETFDHRYLSEFQQAQCRPALLRILTRLTVEEMASGDAIEILGNTFASAVKDMDASDATDVRSAKGSPAALAPQSPTTYQRRPYVR